MHTCALPYLSCTLSFLLFYFPRRSVASFPFVLSVVLQKGSQRRNVKVHFTWEKLNSNGLHRFLEKKKKKKISILQVIIENVVQNSSMIFFMQIRK